jgi:hypothetical protein
MTSNETPELGSAEEVPQKLRPGAASQPISFATRLLLSLSFGCLFTGMLYLLFLLAAVNMARSKWMGWKNLYDVVTTLGWPAIRCAMYLHPEGLDKEFLWLVVASNVVIYSSMVLLISSVYLRWAKH